MTSKCLCFCQAFHPETSPALACAVTTASTARVAANRLTGPALTPMCASCAARFDENIPLLSPGLARYLPMLEQHIDTSGTAAHMPDPTGPYNPSLFLWIPQEQRAGAMLVSDREWDAVGRSVPSLIKSVARNWEKIRGGLPLMDMTSTEIGAVLLCCWHMPGSAREDEKPQRWLGNFEDQTAPAREGVPLRTIAVWEKTGASGSVCRYETETTAFGGGPVTGLIGEALARLLEEIRHT